MMKNLSIFLGVVTLSWLLAGCGSGRPQAASFGPNQQSDSPLPPPTTPSEEGYPFGPSVSPPPASPSSPASQEAQQALQYVSDQYAVPVADLLLVNELELTYPLTQRTIIVFEIAHKQGIGSPIYSLVLDPSTGQFSENGLDTIEAAETAAAEAMYGKFEPSLYNRLQTASEEELLPVRIGVAGDDEMRSQEELYAELAARYPEAAQAMAQSGKPFDVADPVLAEEIWETYQQLSQAEFEAAAERAALRAQPVIDWLQQQGFAVETFAGTSPPTAILPKRVILELAQRDDISNLWLGEAPVVEPPPIVCPSAALPFETLEWVEWPGADDKAWLNKKPGLLIVSSSDDLETASQFMTDDSRLALDQLDFTTHFAIIVFRGWQPKVHEGFQVECVVRQGDEVTLEVQPGYLGEGEAENSPYHLIKLRKEGDWNRTIEFKLRFAGDDRVVATGSHFIP